MGPEARPPKRGDEEVGNQRSSGPAGSHEAVRLTLLPHVHVVHLPVAVLGLADAAVGQRVAGVVGVHSEIEVVAWVSHGELEDREKQRVGVQGAATSKSYGAVGGESVVRYISRSRQTKTWEKDLNFRRYNSVCAKKF